MYKIEKQAYGFRLTFADFIKKDEMTAWVKDSENALAGAKPGFGVFVDMRTLMPLPEDTKPVMLSGQKLYKMKGMVRSVVILNNPITTLQFKSIAQQSGIYQWERYIDASHHQDWEAAGIAWLKDGKDPDK